MDGPNFEAKPLACVTAEPKAKLIDFLQEFSASGDDVLQGRLSGYRSFNTLYLTVQNQIGVSVQIPANGYGEGVEFVIPRECVAAVKFATKHKRQSTVTVYEDHVILEWINRRMLSAADSRFLAWADEVVAGDVYGMTITSHVAEEERLQALDASLRERVRQRGAWLRQFITTRVMPETPCPYCDSPIGDDWQADHIEPVSNGGLSMLSNMVAVCYACNQGKGSRSLAQFIVARGFDFDVVIDRLRQLNKRVDDIDPDPQRTLF
ncbi:hypothetical protein GC176_00085 [bacterium]|nr:hypothetical protein [bacterium]